MIQSLALLFLSTLSLRRATTLLLIVSALCVFLSTLSLRRATLRVLDGSKSSIISIHALLTESDGTVLELQCVLGNFYPRSPYGERLHYDNYNLHCTEISIHALLTESDISYLSIFRQARISIHALLTESDPGKVKVVEPGCVFLSTLSLRRATHPNMSDHPHNTNFYPRSPYGERLSCARSASKFGDFYPRSPYGERPRIDPDQVPGYTISIHALLTESDTR